MKANTSNNIEFVSENVQDVLNRNPHWILRNGISSVFIFLIVILIGSYFIEYPEKRTFEITISKDSEIVNYSEKTKNSTNFIGRIRVPLIYSDKIKKDQDVLIKLINYFNNKKRSIHSKVSLVYVIPNDDHCVAEVHLSTNSSKLLYRDELSGTALLTVGKSRLLLKIFHPLKSIFKKTDENYNK